MLLISPLPIDFCIRDFQPENQANLVNSDTQWDTDVGDWEGQVSGNNQGEHQQAEGDSNSGWEEMRKLWVDKQYSSSELEMALRV